MPRKKKDTRHPIEIHFQATLDEARAKLGLTLEAVAQRAGLGRVTVYRAIHGPLGMRIGTMLKIAAAVELDPVAFISPTPPPPPTKAKKK